MVNVRLDFHWLTVSQRRDLVYAGAGATSNSNFGYVGAATGGHDDLAYVAHVMVNVKPLDHFAFNLFYGHAFGQTIVNANFAGQQGNYGFVEAIVSF